MLSIAAISGLSPAARRENRSPRRRWRDCTSWRRSASRGGVGCAGRIRCPRMSLSATRISRGGAMGQRGSYTSGRSPLVSPATRCLTIERTAPRGAPGSMRPTRSTISVAGWRGWPMRYSRATRRPVIGDGSIGRARSPRGPPAPRLPLHPRIRTVSITAPLALPC